MGNEPTGENVTIGQNGHGQKSQQAKPSNGINGGNPNYNHQHVANSNSNHNQQRNLNGNNYHHQGGNYKNGNNMNGKSQIQQSQNVNMNVTQNQNHYKQQRISSTKQVYGAQYQHQHQQYPQYSSQQQQQQGQYQKYLHQQQQMQHHQNGHNNNNNNNNYAQYSQQNGHSHYNYPPYHHQRQTVQKVNKTRKIEHDEQKKNKNNGFAITKTKSLQDFELKTLVGKGSFGQVWQVEMKSNRKIYALKILKKKDLVARKQVTHTNTERQILANIDHPFLVSLRFAFQTKTKLYMVMDFFNGGELFYHLQKEGKFTENRAKFYSAEILLAIECLHDNNITYRDLKPENILLDQSGHIKITDFGLSKQLTNEGIANDANCITRTFCGSPEYLAPEMLQQNGYSFMVDWWSFGTILYEMICGLPPFYDQNIQKMYQNILYQPIPFYKFMTKSSIELISRLLDKNPLKRIKCKEMKQHLFYKDIDWIKLFKKEIEPPFKPKVNGPDDRQNFEKIANSQNEKTYLKCTPSIKSESVIAAADQFPNFTFDETQDMINID